MILAGKLKCLIDPCLPKGSDFGLPASYPFEEEYWVSGKEADNHFKE